VSEDVRVSIPIPKDLNDKLNTLLPWGIKAQVIRELICLLISAQERDSNSYIVQDLLNGHCTLMRSKFEQVRSDET
jgi:DNA-directed RNA polymerase specialized sigma54-like protein